MNYFNELLESYNKLKKRTFKLRYLNEDENTVVAEVINILKKNAKGSEWSPVPELGDSFNVRISKDGSLGVQDLSMQRNSNVVDPAGGQIMLNGTAQKIWDHMLSVLGGTEPQEEGELEASPGEMAIGQADVIGGAFELFYAFQVKPSTIKNLEKVKITLDKYCKAYESYMNTDRSLAKFCSNKERYLTGGSSWGLEYKLARGAGIEFDEDTGEILRRVPLSPDLIDQAVESFEMLTEYLVTANKDDCTKVLERIGRRNNDLILYGESSSEGILIPKYLTSELASRALASVEKTCGAPKSAKHSPEYFSSQDKNNVVGNMYENVLQFNIKLAALARNATIGLNIDGERNLVMKEFADILKKNKQVLDQLSLEIDPEVAVDIRTAFVNNEVMNNLAIYTDVNSFKTWVQREISFTQNIVNFMEADSAESVGRATRTGGREDTLFVYADQLKAQQKAKIIGSTVQVLQDGRFGVGVGQKRKESLSSVKFGEVNTRERMQQLVDETIEATDMNIEPGFLNVINDLQFGSSYAASEERANMLTYAKNIEHKVSKAAEQVELNKVYFDDQGDLKANTAENICKSIANQFKKDFSYTFIKNSILGKALFKDSKGSSKLKDFSDVDNRKRLGETLSRVLRFSELAKEIRKGSKHAQDYLVRMALICGSNVRDMSQIITGDSGESKIFPHNEIFKRLAQDNLSGDLQVHIEPGTSTAYFTLSDGLTLRFSQEGTGSGEKRNTRSLTQISKPTIEALAVSVELKDTNESMLLKFLEGQKLLIESIFNQTKNNLEH